MEPNAYRTPRSRILWLSIPEEKLTGKVLGRKRA